MKQGSHKNRALKFLNIAGVTLLAVVPLVVGCGDRPPISSAVEINFGGSARKSNGELLGDTPITVFSAENNRELRSSTTDGRGDFSMLLPGQSSYVLVEIDGIQSQPIPRLFAGSSIMSTSLERADSGEISTKGLFEVQIDPGSLCDGVNIQHNEIFNQSDIPSSCLVNIMLGSSDYPISTFSAVVKARCGDDEVKNVNALAQGTSVFFLDLGSIANKGCTPYAIQISSSQDPDRVAEVPIQ
jgi:hypothetical protein